MRYLLLEDAGHRIDQIELAVGTLAAADARRVELKRESIVGQLLDQVRYPVEALARFDGFFVDFDLSTERFHGAGEFELRRSDAIATTVTATTGIGALLYLSQVFDSSEYQEARAEHVAAHGGPPVAHLFSFVELENTRSRFFAAAAHGWFGAEYVRALPNPAHLAGVLVDPVSWPSGARERGVVGNASRVLDALLRVEFPRPRWAASATISTYDWCRIYLEMGGKNSTQQVRRFREAVRACTGLESSWPRLTHHVDDRYWALQLAFGAFLDAFPPGSGQDWEVAWTDQSDDPLLRALQQSELFWTSEDVRIALAVRAAR